MGRGPGVRTTSKSSIGIDFRYKGVRFRERISLPPTPANRKYAQRLKATIEHEIAIGTFNYAKHFPESKRARGVIGAGLERELLDYCDSLAGQLQPETLFEYRRDAKIIAAGFPDRGLGTITRADIRLWVSKLKMGKKRIDNLLIPLRGALGVAIEDEKIKSNPLADFRVKRITGARDDIIDPFTPEEVEKLSGATHHGAMWKLWAWTGMRTGEIIALEAGDVDVMCSSINVWRSIRLGREKAPKTISGNRRIDLLPPAREALRSLSNGKDLPFRMLNGNQYIDDQEVRRSFARACKEVGVRYRYPYQLRHTFATWALSSGENPKWAATQMGHKDMITFFKVYAKWMDKLEPNAGSKMTAAAKSKAA
jgi:integrase